MLTTKLPRARYILATVLQYLLGVTLLALLIGGASPLLIFFFAAGWLWAFVEFLGFWHQAWSLIQDGHARTSSGAAVGLLFVPFVNLFWQFYMFWGLPSDINAYIRRHGLEVPLAPRWPFLAAAMLNLITFPLLWLMRFPEVLFAPALLGVFALFQAPNVGLYAIGISYVCRTLNHRSFAQDWEVDSTQPLHTEPGDSERTLDEREPHEVRDSSPSCRTCAHAIALGADEVTCSILNVARSSDFSCDRYAARIKGG